MVDIDFTEDNALEDWIEDNLKNNVSKDDLPQENTLQEEAAEEANDLAAWPGTAGRDGEEMYRSIRSDFLQTFQWNALDKIKGRINFITGPNRPSDYLRDMEKSRDILDSLEDDLGEMEDEDQDAFENMREAVDKVFDRHSVSSAEKRPMKPNDQIHMDLLNLGQVNALELGKLYGDINEEVERLNDEYGPSRYGKAKNWVIDTGEKATTEAWNIGTFPFRGGKKAALWAGSEAKEDAFWLGGELKDGAFWTGGKLRDAGSYTGSGIKSGAVYAGSGIESGALWAGEKAWSGITFLPGKAYEKMFDDDDGVIDEDRRGAMKKTAKYGGLIALLTGGAAGTAVAYENRDDIGDIIDGLIESESRRGGSGGTSTPTSDRTGTPTGTPEGESLYPAPEDVGLKLDDSDDIRVHESEVFARKARQEGFEGPTGYALTQLGEVYGVQELVNAADNYETQKMEIRDNDTFEVRHKDTDELLKRGRISGLYEEVRSDGEIDRNKVPGTPTPTEGGN